MSRSPNQSPNKLEQKRARSHAAFLQAGIDSLQSPAATLDQLRAQELSQLASRTSGSFFNIWKTQQAYKEELAATILSPENDIDYDVITQQTKESELTGLSKRRLWTSATMGALLVQPTFAPRIAIYNTPGVDEGTADLLAEYYGRQQQKVVDSVAEAFDVRIQEDESSAIVFAVEDLTVRSIRDLIDLSIAAATSSRLIPEF